MREHGMSWGCDLCGLCASHVRSALTALPSLATSWGTLTLKRRLSQMGVWAWRKRGDVLGRAAGADCGGGVGEA